MFLKKEIVLGASCLLFTVAGMADVGLDEHGAHHSSAADATKHIETVQAAAYRAHLHDHEGDEAAAAAHVEEAGSLFKALAEDEGTLASALAHVIDHLKDN